MPYLDALRPEMRPSVSEVPLIPWLPLVGLLGMPAMILPPLPCSSSFGLLPHTEVMCSRTSMQPPGQLQDIYDLHPEPHTHSRTQTPNHAGMGWSSH